MFIEKFLNRYHLQKPTINFDCDTFASQTKAPYDYYSHDYQLIGNDYLNHVLGGKAPGKELDSSD